MLTYHIPNPETQLFLFQLSLLYILYNFSMGINTPTIHDVLYIRNSVKIIAYSRGLCTQLYCWCLFLCFLFEN